MKFLRIDLLTLLISLFILSGCKNQSGIGLTPENQLNGTLMVDTNIIVNTVLEDSVVTSGALKTPLGFINDSQIGTTEANAVFGIGLPGNAAYTLPTGVISIDSAVLVLRYNDGFYGDSLTTRYKVDVRRLTERPLSSTSYYSTKVWGFEPTLLGTRTVNSRTHTSIKITDIVKGGKDTLKTVPAQMRIPIDTNFIRFNFFGASASALASNTIFQNNIKGLHVSVDKSTITTSTGGTFMVRPDSTRIDVYYRVTNAGTVDTAVVTLPVTASAAGVKHTYNAAVTAALANTTASANTFYIQGLAGLRAKISFPKLKDIIAQAGSDIVLNRAELVITPLPGTTIPLAPQSRITMYQLDIAKQRTALQDASTADKRFQGASVFGGYYTSNSDYHFIITGYIEDLLRGKTIDNGTYIGAVDIASTSETLPAGYYNATIQASGRLVAVGTVGKTATNFPYRVKLNIIYTKINTVK